MKKYVVIAVAATALFAVSAGASLWLQNQGKDAKPEKPAPAPGQARFGAAELRNPRPATADKAPAAPVNEREKALAEREEAINRSQKNLDLVREDLRKERAGLEELRKKIQDELTSAAHAISLPGAPSQPPPAPGTAMPPPIPPVVPVVPPLPVS